MIQTVSNLHPPFPFLCNTVSKIKSNTFIRNDFSDLKNVGNDPHIAFLGVFKFWYSSPLRATMWRYNQMDVRNDINDFENPLLGTHITFYDLYDPDSTSGAHSFHFRVKLLSKLDSVTLNTSWNICYLDLYLNNNKCLKGSFLKSCENS